MMRAAFLFTLLVFSSLMVQAQQFPGEKFHFGSVTLSDGKELKGRIKYDLDADVILLMETGKRNISTINASQFQSFTIEGGIGMPQRTFYSVPVMNQTGYRRPKIFELIHQGGMSLVAREFIATRARRSNRMAYTRSMYDPSISMVTYRYLAYDLWLIDEQANLFKLGNTRNDVLEAFPNHQSELRKFIKREKLKVDKIEDLKRLVEHYNGLDNL